MQLELSNDEARFLEKHLARHIEEMDLELVHTDKHALQHALAAEIERLKVIYGRLQATPK